MQCVTKAKSILQAKKAGHAGTLDPKVTGLMLIAFDEAVKAIPVLMGLDKEYEGMIYFHKYLSLSEIKQAFKNFTGEII
ncbi:MAG: RNA-guided pseudouridylation complex pseudouridine synthase subunit Cbf5, partial [Candidatus Aenigmatarchaeota archaeon]